MRIGGFQKLTLLDFPGQMACIVFTPGCNFRCPYCHNAGLALRREDAGEVSEEEVLAYLEKRRGLLEGVVVTGGEPLLQPDLEEFLRKARDLGYLIKLDTNGSFPQRLDGLLQAGLLDYVAMDLKHSPEGYSKAAGTDASLLLPRIGQSVSLLLQGRVPYEFRTTLVKGLHTPGDVERIAGWIAGDSPYYLQSYADSGDILSPEGLGAFSREELEQMLLLAKKHCPRASLRGL